MTATTNKTAAIQNVLEATTAVKTGNFYNMPMENLSLQYQPVGPNTKFPRWAVNHVDNEDVGTFFLYHASNDEEQVKAMFGNPHRLQFRLFASKRDAATEIYFTASGRKVEGVEAPINYNVIDAQSAAEMLEDGYVAKSIEFNLRQSSHIEDLTRAKAFNNGNIGKIMQTASKEERNSFFGGLAGSVKNLFS